MIASRRAALQRIVRTSFAVPALYACGGGGGSNAQTLPGSSSRRTVNVRDVGARGDGRNDDLAALRTALAQAIAQPGSDLLLPAGEYWLGETANPEALLAVDGATDLGIIGDGAVLRARTLNGITSFFFFTGSRRVFISGLSFRDDGLDRAITWQGGSAIYISGDGGGCAEFTVRQCRFESVLAALTVAGTERPVSDIVLDDLVVRRSYYGLNFQNNGDRVRATNLVFDDLRRAYFPYGVDDHDIAFTSRNNATGSTDLLIKCYSRPTTNLRIAGSVTGKRGGESMVSFEHEHRSGEGVIAGVNLRLDVADADCALENLFVFRSYAPNGTLESNTRSVWRDIRIDGTFGYCDARTAFLTAPSAPAERATVRFGASVDPRFLPAAPAGFELVRDA